MTTPQPAALPELLREIVAYCREAGHDWSNLTEAEHRLAALQSQPAAKCDGNHGGPRCADPECWNDSPAQPAAPGVTGAVQTLIEALKADPEYAWTWHCNVAMAAVDEGLSHYAANKAAARFLSLLAQIDTTKHPGFPKAPEQPAAEVSDADIENALGAPNYHNGFGRHPDLWTFAQIKRAILALRPQAVPMTDDTSRLDWIAEQFGDVLLLEMAKDLPRDDMPFREAIDHLRGAPSLRAVDAGRPCHVYNVTKHGSLVEWEPTTMAFAMRDGTHAVYTLPADHHGITAQGAQGGEG